MGRWVYKTAKRAPLQNYFRSYFFAGLFGNFIGLIACTSVKYFDEEITKAKWKGLLSGLGFSVAGFTWAIIASLAIKNSALVAVTLLILLAGIMFGILYKYKGHEKAKQSSTQPISIQNISPQLASPWIETYLTCIGMSQNAIKAAMSDDNLPRSFILIQKNPSISKEEFLTAMNMVDDQNSTHVNNS